MPAEALRPLTLSGSLSDLWKLVRQIAVQVHTTTIENVNTVSSSGSALTLVDVDVATMHRVTLTANCTLTFPSAGAGKSFSLELVQDGTGSRTVTWPGTVLWTGGTDPTLSTAASSVDDFAFVCFDGTNWSGFFAGKGMAQVLAARRMMIAAMRAHVSDDFNRPDDAGPPLGTGWSTYVPQNSSMGSQWGVYNNEAYQSFFGNNAIPVTNDGYFGMAYRNDWTSGDLDMKFTFAYLHQGIGQPYYGIDQYAGGAFRMADDASPNGYRFTVAKLQQFVAGTPTTLTTWGTPFAAGDIVRVVANGSAVEIFQNGTSIYTFTDSSFSANTRHGLAENPGSPPNGIVSDTNRYDDFDLQTPQTFTPTPTGASEPESQDHGEG